MKRANENDKDIWYVYGYDSEGDFVLIKDYEDKLVRPVIGWKTDDKKPTVTTTDIMNHAKVFYKKNDAERLIKWLKNNWVILNDEMVDYDDLKVGYKDKYENIYDIDTERCVLVNSDGDEELEESVMTNERDIIQAFDSKNVRIVETKFHDYDVYLAGTNKKLAVISVERGIICVAINGENRQFPITKLDNAVDFVNDIVISARLKKESFSIDEAKNVLINNGYEIEETFIKDDSDKIDSNSADDVFKLGNEILKRAGYMSEQGTMKMEDHPLISSAVNYIAAFYAKQHMPRNGMIVWGTRDLKKFVSELGDDYENDEKLYNSVRNVRSIMLGNPPGDLKNSFIEKIKGGKISEARSSVDNFLKGLSSFAAQAPALSRFWDDLKQAFIDLGYTEKEYDNIVHNYYRDIRTMREDGISPSEIAAKMSKSITESLDEALEGPATSKQLWTLFKLTRQDYRGKDLSKEEASKMIGDLIAKIKNGENKTEPKAKKSKPVEDDSNSPVKVGEIYHRNWGYSMCINTYFKVLGVKGKKARVVELDKKAVSGSLMQGRVVPIETPRSDAEELLGMIKNDGTLRIKLYGNYETYRKWDGQSDYEDHMD